MNIKTQLKLLTHPYYVPLGDIPRNSSRKSVIFGLPPNSDIDIFSLFIIERAPSRPEASLTHSVYGANSSHFDCYVFHFPLNILKNKQSPFFV